MRSLQIREMRIADDQTTRITKTRTQKPVWLAAFCMAAASRLAVPGYAEAAPGTDEGLMYKAPNGITCSISIDPASDRGSISCQRGNIQRGVLLNVPMTSPRRLRCSGNFCAVLDSDTGVLIITLGTEEIMGRRRGFGFYGGGYTYDNSYVLFLPEGLKPESIRETSIEGNEIRLHAEGRVWSIDLTNPNASRWVVR